ncbi:MAG TPA: hypothetical protein VH089_11090 [Streptosporangiaceae bacterium]|nr:hypothetical protein [Streptosporangiaceae bacterium]
MTDTELIEELRWALDEETTGVWAKNDLAARARTRARRRRTLRGLLASLPAAGIATGLLVAGLPGTSATPAVPSPRHAAYVTSHVEAALGRTSGYVMRTTFEPSPGATTITWLDPLTGDARQVTSGPGGQVTTWTRAVTRNDRPMREQTTVDAGNRTWWSVAVAVGAAAEKVPVATKDPAAASPALIIQALEQGQVTLAGQQKVDGKTAVILRLITEKAMAQLWVDRATYRPVRIVFGAGADGAGQYALDVAWVPRSAALLATLSTPRVPAGYTDVTTPPAG